MMRELRSTEGYESAVNAAAAAELADAKAGVGDTGNVSARAAAKFLKIHRDTLAEWRRRSPPSGPPFKKNSRKAGGGVNQHVTYDYAELVAWDKARQGVTPIEHALAAKIEEARWQLHQAELELELARLTEKIATAKKKVARISFATLADCAAANDWTWRDGAISGHVLTVFDEELNRALCDPEGIASLSLEEALGEPWSDPEQRAAFDEAMEGAITGARKRAGNGLELSEKARSERALEALGDIPAGAPTRRTGP